MSRPSFIIHHIFYHSYPHYFSSSSSSSYNIIYIYIYIAEAFARNSTLLQVSLRDNRLDSRAGKALLQAYKHCKYLVEMALSSDEIGETMMMMMMMMMMVMAIEMMMLIMVVMLVMMMIILMMNMMMNMMMMMWMMMEMVMMTAMTIVSYFYISFSLYLPITTGDETWSLFKVK